MTQETAQLVTTICFITGTFLLAIEAVGRDRAVRVEQTIQNIAQHAERLFSGVIVMFAAPWRSVEDVVPELRANKSRARRLSPLYHRIPRWFGPAFLFLAFVSAGVFALASRRYGEGLVTVVCISSWFGMTVAGVVMIWSLETFQQILKNADSLAKKLKLLILSALIATAGIAFGITALITLLSCWPAAVIFLIYVLIYLLATALRRLIDFRVRFGLGNIFILLGLILAISGIVLQHLISIGRFQR